MEFYCHTRSSSVDCDVLLRYLDDLPLFVDSCAKARNNCALRALPHNGQFIDRPQLVRPPMRAGDPGGDSNSDIPRSSAQCITVMLPREKKEKKKCSATETLVK